MKTTISLLLFFIFGLFLLLPGFIHQDKIITDNTVIKAETSPNEDNEPVKGPELEKWYFEQWHYPYGNVLSPDKLNNIWTDINRLPDEKNMNPLAVNSWSCIGPYGMNNTGSPGTKYSGRILDIEVENGASTRLAAASGGLWGFVLIIPIPLSDALSSLAVGSFATKPGDANTIFLGTGEPSQRGGTGMYKTTNGGTLWTAVTLTPTPSAFYRIRYSPGSNTIINAVTTAGYYRSDNGGSTWTRKLTGNATDIAINPNNTSVMYTALWNDGIYKSVDGGNTWNKLTSGGIPTSNIGRVGLSLCKSSPNIVYAAVSRNDNSQLMGVYKSLNDGSTWTNVSPPSNYLGGQGWYDNVIGICPTNSNIVIVGGVSAWRTANGGSSWTQISDANVHADHHAITWNSAGTAVWEGNDGGMSYSADAGVTWSTSANICPITQYVNIGVGVNNTGVIFGGSQDNGYSGTTNGGSVWNFTLGGDGGGISIDPNDAHRVFGTLGVYGGNWAFQRHRSVDFGQTWVGINNGIDPSGQWYHKIRNDQVGPVYLFNNSGPYVYTSTNYGDQWTKLNATAFPTSEVYNMTVSRYTSPSAVVYACLPSTTTTTKLRVYDSGTWYERSTGFPSSVWVHAVKPHPTNSNIAYAVMNSFSAGQKVFKTTNRGQVWTNITGDLPDIPLADIVPHPTDNNKLYLGSEMGCYKTTNGGVNWIRWNNGMPQANIISEMSYIDSISSNGRYYIVAGTYGRAIWIREISGDDPIGITNTQTSVPDKFALKQNYPNPFNPTTTIEFSLPVKDAVTINVFDITGRLVTTLMNREMPAGTHKLVFDASKLSSGVYFYTIKTNAFTDTKKMILIK
jgi:photosystem II stability/assembly factor-like uncharacterized protein